MSNKTRLAGFLFSKPSPETVWQKARVVDYASALNGYRMDRYGNWIHFKEYGNRNSRYGWEMDHNPIPKSSGGLDIYDNLEPVYWKANVQKSDSIGVGLQYLYTSR